MTHRAHSSLISTNCDPAFRQISMLFNSNLVESNSYRCDMISNVYIVVVVVR